MRYLSELAFCMGALSLPVLPSCGSDESPPPEPAPGGGGGEAGSGGNGGAGSAQSGSADAGPLKYGVRYNETRGCVERADMVEVGVNGADFQGGYYCLRRRSDGAVYWTTTVSELAFDGSIWEDCTPDDPATVPPPPLFRRPMRAGTPLALHLC